MNPTRSSVQLVGAAAGVFTAAVALVYGLTLPPGWVRLLLLGAGVAGFWIFPFMLLSMLGVPTIRESYRERRRRRRLRPAGTPGILDALDQRERDSRNRERGDQQ